MPRALLAAVALPVAAWAAEPAFFDARVAPIFDQHCNACHGAKKQKAGLRLDSFDAVLKGAESGSIVKAGDVKGSELHRRVTLPREDDEVMPADGKPLLSADEIKTIELWIAAGASPTQTLADFPGAPALRMAKAAPSAVAPDWRPRAKEIAALEKSLGVRLLPRSQSPTDGLILRTASAPQRCDDAALAQLAPVAEFIVDAELARTRVTDAGMKSLGGWANLRSIDLTRTAVTGACVEPLLAIPKLDTINLTSTRIDAAAAAKLKSAPAVRRLWLFGTPAAGDGAAKVVAK